MPFGCSNPLTNMFNQLRRKPEHEHHQPPEATRTGILPCNEWQRLKNYWHFAQCSRRLLLALLDELGTPEPAIRTLHHEIADFCATLGAGEPETPEAMQQELLQRIDKGFDFS